MKLCAKCKNRAAINRAKMCEICILKQTSVRHFGKVDFWEPLGKKLIERNSMCGYSGSKILLGTSASLDHIIATSQGGPNTLDNVEWTHIWVNLAASNRDKAEFYEEFKQFIITAYHHIMRT